MQLLFQLPDTIIQGIIIAIIGYTIVFFALVILYLIFYNMPKLLTWNTRRKLAREGRLSNLEEEVVVTGEEAAAISMAIFLCRDLHDDESDVITINKISKAYSPWSSKIYGLRNFTR
jgi:Na+-transporting methylmalonyl-CoA/oxaloacetate decarboxylase gamma subunit